MSLQQLKPEEHVFRRPEMYIGSMQQDSYATFVCDAKLGMQKRLVTYVPALYKIIDEILVNAIDHSRTSKSLLTRIGVTVDKASGMIQVSNNGDAFPIEMRENGMYTPEMAFGNLLTSTNYDDDVERTVGGQNGIGAKACNIFSDFFDIEICSNGQHYVQTFSDNMTKKTEPVIEPVPKTKPNSISITFQPDFKRFGIEGISNDMFDMLKKRAYDACACTPRYTDVHFNGKCLEVKNFLDYVKLYVADKADIVHEKLDVDPEWEIAVTCNNHGNGLEHISFVNGVYTMQGGKHVDFIVNKIVAKLKEMLEAKTKKAILPGMIRNNIFVFINSIVPNPKFDGQNKNILNTPVSQFGGSDKKFKLEMSDKFYKKLYSSKLYASIMDTYDNKVNINSKKTDGKRAPHIKGLVKLEDANWAGGPKSHLCTLILTEGDSAKAMAMEGLSVIGREMYGVFPLRGKLINVKDISTQKITDNKEIANLKKILGLESNKKYDPETLRKSLRYGHVMIMTDSDHDGQHIRGLVINMFHTLWPSLLTHDFVCSLLTPIVRVQKPRQKDFYTISEFREWSKEYPTADAKYYKGLGTWKASEAKELFKHMNRLSYTYNGDQDDQALNLAFNKNLSDKRKLWIAEHTGKEQEGGGQLQEEQSFETFVNSDLVQFSIHDVERSIPNVMDGLKPSQRKVMFGMFKRNSSKEARVSQIAGYISEHSAYHHGEASLHGTIIGMAQTFVGSGNNLPLLAENGMFGTRNKGGADSAAPRYIHTDLRKVVNKIYNKDDNPTLTFLDDDGQSVEPEYYVPIIPMILINGTRGIGTGFSTQVPSFHPLAVIEATKLWALQYLNSESDTAPASLELDVGMPWYNGFKGTVFTKKKNFYSTRGLYKVKKPDLVVVTELPIGKWTEDYKVHLEDLIEKGVLKTYESHTTDTICFNLMFNESVEDKSYDEMIKLLDLETSGISTNNMHLFDQNRKIKKYESVSEIFEAFARTRMLYYIKRKAYKLKELEHLSRVASSKAEFIAANRDGRVIMSKKSEEDIVAQLKGLEGLYHELGYDYLLKMPINSLSEQRFRELKSVEQKLKEDYQDLSDKKEAQMWLEELETLKLYLSKQP